MKFTKTITKTYELKGVKRKYAKMSQNFRSAMSGREPMHACTWCGHVFEDGEEFSVGETIGWEKIPLCESCADELEKEEKDERVHG